MTHIDFHPGNILVRLRDDEQPELTMIDLDALRTSKHLSWASARENLAKLDHYFWLRSSRADRHRFLKAYLESRQERVADARQFARGIEEATRAWAERLWKRWGRRCRSTNKYYQVYKEQSTWSVADRDLDAAEVASLLADPDGPFSRPQTTLLKNSRTSTVAETTMSVAGCPTRGHLQAIQPQEVDRPLAQPDPAVACLAVVAGRLGPDLPGNRHAPQPRLSGAKARLSR